MAATMYVEKRRSIGTKSVAQPRLCRCTLLVMLFAGLPTLCTSSQFSYASQGPGTWCAFCQAENECHKAWDKRNVSFERCQAICEEWGLTANDIVACKGFTWLGDNFNGSKCVILDWSSTNPTDDFIDTLPENGAECYIEKSAPRKPEATTAAPTTDAPTEVSTEAPTNPPTSNPTEASTQEPTPKASSQFSYASQGPGTWCAFCQAENECHKAWDKRNVSFERCQAICEEWGLTANGIVACKGFTWLGDNFNGSKCVILHWSSTHPTDNFIDTLPENGTECFIEKSAPRKSEATTAAPTTDAPTEVSTEAPMNPPTSNPTEASTQEPTLSTSSQFSYASQGLGTWCAFCQAENECHKAWDKRNVSFERCRAICEECGFTANGTAACKGFTWLGDNFDGSKCVILHWSSTNPTDDYIDMVPENGAECYIEKSAPRKPEAPTQEPTLTTSSQFSYESQGLGTWCAFCQAEGECHKAWDKRNVSFERCQAICEEGGFTANGIVACKGFTWLGDNFDGSRCVILDWSSTNPTDEYIDTLPENGAACYIEKSAPRKPETTTAVATTTTTTAAATTTSTVTHANSAATTTDYETDAAGDRILSCLLLPFLIIILTEIEA